MSTRKKQYETCSACAGYVITHPGSAACGVTDRVRLSNGELEHTTSAGKKLHTFVLRHKRQKRKRGKRLDGDAT